MVYDLAGKAYLWAAREVRSGEVVAIQVTRGRGVGECLRSLERVRGACYNNPTIYTDRAPWYTWPMNRRRSGVRNSIEQWFSKLKRRIKQFNNYFPTHKPKTSERWITAWAALS